MIRDLVRQLIELIPPKAKTYKELKIEDSVLEMFMSGQIVMRFDPEDGELHFVHWETEEEKNKILDDLEKEISILKQDMEDLRRQ